MTRDGKEDSMPHVDEGTLHAYLDGELSPAERTGLEQHLAQCATCRALLADERALRDRSTALLASARPIDQPLPPFEQIHRAPRRPWYLRTSVAWAASIVLAVGLGYYLRDPSSAFESPAPKAVTSTADAPAAAPEQVVTRQATPRAPAGRRTEEKQEAEQDKAAPDSTVAGVVAPEPRLQLRNAAPTAGAPVARNDAEALGAAQSGVVSIRGRAVTAEWQIISRGAATTLLGTDPVGLPGLRTRRIRRSPAPDATVVVEQALDSSTTIQIFQRPMTENLYSERAARDAAPSAAAAPAPADRLARFVGRLRVEISGPLTTDSLNKLLEQVEPIP
jgi:hypothetical protein